MKVKEAASLFLFVACPIAIVLFTSAASASAAVDLESDYVNKVLTLRHFYDGDHLSFAADGTLIGTAELGPWTVDGQVRVQSIVMEGQSLRIIGRRVWVVFDKKNKPYRDVVELIDEEARILKSEGSWKRYSSTGR